MTTQRVEDGEWEFPPVADAMEAAWIWPIKEYIQRRQVTIAAQMACRTIYELCTGAEWMPGYSWMMRWWD